MNLVPLLVCRDASAAVDFYVSALGAREIARHLRPEGLVAHADLVLEALASLDEPVFSVTEEARAWNSDAPPSLGGSTVVMQLHAADVDATFASLLAHGAEVVYPLQEWNGVRMGRARDPFGHLWLVSAGAPRRGSTHTTDVVFVHAWGVDAATLAPLAARLAPNHRVHLVELDAAEHHTIEGYADHVMKTCGVDRPVVVGHSMGGLVALELAARDRVAAAVLLECHVAPPPEAIAALMPAVERLERKEEGKGEGEIWRATAEALLRLLTGPEFPPAQRERLLAVLRTRPQAMLSASLRAAVTFDSAAALPRVRCPLLYIGTSTPYADLPRFRASCPQLVTAQVVAADHFFPLSATDQVAPMIERFLSAALGA